MVEVLEFDTLDTLLTEDEEPEVEVLLVNKLFDDELVPEFATGLVVLFAVVGFGVDELVAVGLVVVGLVVVGLVVVEFSVKFKSIP